MDSKEYQRLLENEEMKRQEEATLAEQEARFNRAKEIRAKVNQLKRFFNSYIPKDSICERYNVISSIKIEAQVEPHYVVNGADCCEPVPIIIENVSPKLAKQFIEMSIDILNEKFKRL